MPDKKVPRSPIVPAPYTLADASALQALHRGDASADQQQRALKWLIEQCADTYYFHFYPTERETAFALGRAFAGQQIVKLVKLDLSSLRRQSNEPTSTTRSPQS